MSDLASRAHPHHVLTCICAMLPFVQVAYTADIEVRRLGYGRPLAAHQDTLAFSLNEAAIPTDLNGDGDASDEVLHLNDVMTGVTRNLGLAVYRVQSQTQFWPMETPDLPWFAFSVPEIAQGGNDLNADGDTNDSILHVIDLRSGHPTNLGYAIDDDRGFSVCPDGRLLFHLQDGCMEHDLMTGEAQSREDCTLSAPCVYPGRFEITFVYEDHISEDVNGDGDTHDYYFTVQDNKTGRSTMVPIAVGFFDSPDTSVVFSGGWLAFNGNERAQGADLNGDGDDDDAVGVLYHPESEGTWIISPGFVYWGHSSGCAGGLEVALMRDWVLRLVGGTPWTLSVLRMDTGETSELPLDGFGERHPCKFFHGDRWAAVSGAPVLVLVFPEIRSPTFRRADSNDDAKVDIADAIATLGYLFLDPLDPMCLDGLDANDDGTVDISDAITTLSALFLGHVSIPLPGTVLCGGDPTVDALDCELHRSCP